MCFGSLNYKRDVSTNCGQDQNANQDEKLLKNKLNGNYQKCKIQ